MGKGIFILLIAFLCLIITSVLFFNYLNFNNEGKEKSGIRVINEETILLNNSTAKDSSFTFFDDFSGYETERCYADTESFGSWNLAYGGYGCVKIENSSDGNKFLHESPNISVAKKDTYASLVLGPLFDSSTKLFNYSVTISTEQQLRKFDSPNSWEAAWIIWHYSDDKHFYYFVLKPNGIELGKEDPNYEGNQRFIFTGVSPKLELGKWYNVTIIQDNINSIKIYINNEMWISTRDSERPYTRGRIGLYNEDAHVHFDDVKIMN